ncbi:MAG: aldo/keto reductase [Oceanicaulis sp.]|uniref:aldo/keto reductase n=1 Tax=Glycocaulis sp. TaxID=1969725 RepID=UPI0025BD77F8|nr:aldo/keto reductase [Glycocaulis sp.]MCC5981753.1 aldo/keto reductase [Oceanicaulis sp.]MCH8520473.1 aldo/keto reductase [Glycocaulis sp.]
MSILPSRLGFGVSGAHGTLLMPARATHLLVEQAFAGGVRVFDTAPAYGAGEAETRLGRALRDLPREQVFITTKAGVTSAGLARRIRDFSPDAIEASLTASLARMGLEGVDALILHGPDPAELTDALLARLDALKSAGAFRHLGVAGRGAELDGALGMDRFALVMAPVHPFIGAAARARLMAARAKGTAIMGIEAAGAGPAPLRLPRTPADLYAFIRTLRSGEAPSPRAAMPAALADPLKDAMADCVVMTTTRAPHLADNIAAVNAVG